MDYWTRMEAKRNNYTDFKKMQRDEKQLQRDYTISRFISLSVCGFCPLFLSIQVTERIVSTELLVWPTLYQTSV